MTVHFLNGLAPIGQTQIELYKPNSLLRTPTPCDGRDAHVSTGLLQMHSDVLSHGNA